MNDNIIITGAGGLVATELTMLLLRDSRFSLYLVSTNPLKLRERYKEYANVQCYALEEFSEYAKTSGVHFRSLVHAAFARSSEGDLLAQSLDYCSRVLHLAKSISLESYINISSQSVYGQKSKPLWHEDTLLAPDYMYALGKYATEVLTNIALEGTEINYTNLRLCSVCENARFLNVFVKNALAGKPIRILGGKQTCSFIDVRDVADALKTMIVRQDAIDFERQYNLGTGESYSIESLAFKVKDVAFRYYNIEVDIEKEESDIRQEVGMNSDLFYETFDWRPCFSMEQMIKSLFEYLTNIKNGGGNFPVSFKIVYEG